MRETWLGPLHALSASAKAYTRLHPAVTAELQQITVWMDSHVTVLPGAVDSFQQGQLGEEVACE